MFCKLLLILVINFAKHSFFFFLFLVLQSFEGQWIPLSDVLTLISNWISLLSLHYTIIIISSKIQNYRLIFVQTISISRKCLKPKSLSNKKLLKTVLLLEIYWLSLQWYSSEGFEGSVKPSQPSDIKNTLYWQTQYMRSKVTGKFTQAFTKLALYSVFSPINICCGSRFTNKLTNSEVENWFNEHSHMTVARFILIYWARTICLG